MGGRSSAGTRNTENSMNVPYEAWGDMIGIERITENGQEYWIEDNYHSEMEPEHRKITKKQVIDEISGWLNDDGTYGTGDEAIYVAYEDGKFLNLTDGDPHKRWSKQGISGLSVSTGDYEMVWGGEYIRPKYGSPRFEPYTTHEFDENANVIEGFQNSYSGYKTTARWKVRTKTSYVYNEKTGKYDTVREIIRQSTKKKY